MGRGRFCCLWYLWANTAVTWGFLNQIQDQPSMQHASTCSSEHSSLLVHFEFNKSNYADKMFSKYFKASEQNIIKAN